MSLIERYFACPKCASREFIRLEVVRIDTKGVALKVEAAGVFRCNNCNTRISIEAQTGEITIVEMSAKATTVPRVKSSVTSEKVIEERRF